MQKPTVLIIAEDDPLRAALEISLEQSGCDVMTAGNGLAGIDKARSWRPDVVLVSPTLREPGSEDVCRRIRVPLPGNHTPVFVLIPDAHNLQQSSFPVAGYGNSSRPLDPDQFAQGIAALASSTSEKRLLQTHVVTQGLHLDRESFRSEIDGRELRLTPTEFNILWQLARNVGAVLSRQALCEECRDDPSNSRCRSVDVHVRSLRLKLQERADLIETVRGVGYRLNESARSQLKSVLPVADGHS